MIAQEGNFLRVFVTVISPYNTDTAAQNDQARFL